MMRFLAPLAMVALALTACGGGNEPSAHRSTPSPAAVTSASPTPTKAAVPPLRSAVKAYSDAYLTGDAKGAYALLSARCQKRMSAPEFRAIVAQARDLYGSALPIKTYHADVQGDLARVSYTYDVSAINQDSEPWVLEDGAWHEDDC